jgi:hypothetical protein
MAAGSRWKIGTRLQSQGCRIDADRIRSGKAMMKNLLSAVALAVALLGSASLATAKRYPPSYWEQRDRDMDNRRDARRAGLAAAVVASGASRAVQSDRIEERYRECMLATRYDEACDRQRLEQQLEARRNARRKGLVAGIVTREIVRD